MARLKIMVPISANECCHLVRICRVRFRMNDMNTFKSIQPEPDTRLRQWMNHEQDRFLETHLTSAALQTRCDAHYLLVCPCIGCAIGPMHMACSLNKLRKPR